MLEGAKVLFVDIDEAGLAIASINSRQPADGMYCSAKAGLEMLTRCAAGEPAT